MHIFSFFIAKAINAHATERVPVSAKDEKNVPEKTKWKSAIADELQSVVSSKVFMIVKVLEYRKIIACRWVFSLKLN